MTRAVVRTGYGADLIAAKAVGGIHTCQQYSTLNEAVSLINQTGGMSFVSSPGIQPVLVTNSAIGAFSLASWDTSTNADTQAACIAYLAIGDNGVVQTQPSNNNGPTYAVPKGFKARQAGLYNQRPWVLRQYSSSNPNWDLTPQQQANYRHRVWVSIGGQLYVAYFLRKLYLTAPSVTLQYVSVSNSVQTPTTFTPTLNDLVAPTPPGSPTGDFMQSVAPVAITLTSFDVTELLNVAQVLYGNPDQAMITEMALVSGVEKQVYASTDSQTLSNVASYEACGCQCYTFYSANQPITAETVGKTIGFNLGSTEPLYGV